MSTSGNPEGQIFLSNPQIMDSFFCSSLNAAFIFQNKLPEVPEYFRDATT